MTHFIKKRAFLLTWALGATAALAACGGDQPSSPPPPPVSVQLTAPGDSVYVQATMAVTATVTGDAAAPTLASSNTAIFTVTNGIVTGKTPGRAWLIATADEARDSIDLLVVDSVRAVRFSLDSLTVKSGLGSQLTVTLLDSQNHPLTGRVITWFSTDPNTVVSSQVGAIGGVLGGRPGVARVIAQSENRADTVVVTVLIRATRLVIQPATPVLAPGDSVRLTLTAIDSFGTVVTSPGPVIWSSIDPFSASVDSAGYAHAWAADRAVTVTASTTDATGSATITTTRVALAVGMSGGFQGTSCARGAAGGVFCWGSGNTFGQFGNPRLPAAQASRQNLVRSLVPDLQVLGTASGIAFCGLTSTATTWCWGRNDFKQLGGVTAPPGQVPGLSGLVAITTGNYHGCAITQSGDLYCWGGDGFGEVGTGTNVYSSPPVQVSPGTKFLQVAAGNYHNCALRADSLALCWGGNEWGQLGDSTTAYWSRPAPVLVAGSRKYIAIASGDSYSCALAVDGTPWCWGYNFFSQLGTSASGNCYSGISTTCSNVPVQAPGQYQQISAGAGVTCGLSASGVLSCWGNRSPNPVVMDAARQYVTATAGPLCGQQSDGRIYCLTNGTMQLLQGQ